MESAAELHAKAWRENTAAGVALTAHDIRLAKGEVYPATDSPIPDMFGVWTVPMSDGVVHSFRCEGDDDKAYRNAVEFIRQTLANVRFEEAAE